MIVSGMTTPSRMARKLLLSWGSYISLVVVADELVGNVLCEVRCWVVLIDDIVSVDAGVKDEEDEVGKADVSE